MAEEYVLTTASGGSLDLERPSPGDIRISDIAQALSKICRFGAQATTFYSVAQHALEVAARVPAEYRLVALHHDSHEAFVGDVPTPLKKLIRAGTSAYDDICSRLDAVIGAAFGIDARQFKNLTVKQADEVVRVLESRVLLADEGVAVQGALPRLDVPPGTIYDHGPFRRILSPAEAAQEFLDAHQNYS